MFQRTHARAVEVALAAIAAGSDYCLAENPAGLLCNEDLWHRGPHRAFDEFDVLLASWPNLALAVGECSCAWDGPVIAGRSSACPHHGVGTDGWTARPCTCGVDWDGRRILTQPSCPEHGTSP